MQEHFEADARRVEIKVAERFEAYDQILRGTAGLFAASDEVTREDFRQYVDALQLGKVVRRDPGDRLRAPDPARRTRSPRASGAGIRVSRLPGAPGGATRRVHQRRLPRALHGKEPARLRARRLHRAHPPRRHGVRARPGSGGDDQAGDARPGDRDRRPARGDHLSPGLRGGAGPRERRGAPGDAGRMGLQPAPHEGPHAAPPGRRVQARPAGGVRRRRDRGGEPALRQRPRRRRALPSLPSRSRSP